MKLCVPLASVCTMSVLFLAGCMVGPKYTKPTVPFAPELKEAGPGVVDSTAWKYAEPKDQAQRGAWWDLFGDSQLNVLEEELTKNNQNLKVAEAHLRQARSMIQFNRSLQYPQIAISPAIQNVRTSANEPYFNKAYANNGTGDFTLPIDASYEVDFWGKIRRTVHQAQEEAEASSADMEVASLSLHAELARDYFELRSADLQEQLLHETVKAYSKALKLVQSRFDDGTVPKSDVTQAQTQLDAARVQETDVAVARAQYEHAIAALVGTSPAHFSIQPATSSELQPPHIPIGLPSNLLERRPDIAANERRVAEANEQIGITRAAYFPSFVIGATAGFEGTSIANWFNWPSRLWAVGPQVSQFVFDGGRRRAVSEAARAGYDASVAGYRQSAIDAFREVEDNLAALRVLEVEAQQQKEATSSSQESLRIFTRRYEEGVDSYLQVITAQTTTLTNERNDIEILRRRMDSSVLLIKAIGGQW